MYLCSLFSQLVFNILVRSSFFYIYIFSIQNFCEINFVEERTVYMSSYDLHVHRGIYFMNSTWRARGASWILPEKGQRNVNVLQPDM